MARNDAHLNGTSGDSKNPSGLIPGTVFADKAQESPQDSTNGELKHSAGPEVNGRPTTVTLFSPQQLAKSPLVPGLYDIVNEAFDAGHRKSQMLLVNSRRLRYDSQLVDELGSDSGTFTYIVTYQDTEEVVGTASSKRYRGRPYVVAKSDDEKRANTWKRFGELPEGTAAWELSIMAVDVSLQRQGLAGYMMKLVEGEVQRRYKAVAHDEKLSRLSMMITTIKERNLVFYAKRGYVLDYETVHPPGHLGSENGFTVINMSKVIDIQEDQS